MIIFVSNFSEYCLSGPWQYWSWSTIWSCRQIQTFVGLTLVHSTRSSFAKVPIYFKIFASKGHQYRLFFLRSIAQLFCQFISWTNWVNSGKFMDNCWISCQVMADMETIYDDLIIINLQRRDKPWTKIQFAIFLAMNKSTHEIVPFSKNEPNHSLSRWWTDRNLVS